MFEFGTMTVGVSFDLSELEVKEGAEDIFLTFENEENEDQICSRTESALIL